MDATPRPTHLDGPDLDLYTIPRHSSWFRWDNIHEKERKSLKEFFDGSSITRTPKIYKEYRDFIINKYREEPSRTLTFTQIRKCLIGDVTSLYKVFNFLNKWGIINFGVGGNNNNNAASFCEEIGNVRVEDGAPNGIRVVAIPSSLKPISAPRSKGSGGSGDGRGSKLVNLASYSDVFGLEKSRKRVSCGVCDVNCESRWYEYTKGSYVMCEKCFESGKFGEGRSKDDFELKDGVDGSGNEEGVWSEEETLLLLESVMRHGSDWDLVAQHVRTKSKLECIAKLIELPLGDFMLSSTNVRGQANGMNGNLGNLVDVPSSTVNPQETAQSEDHEMDNVNELNGEDAEEGPPLKRKRIDSLSDGGSNLMKQIALISTMVDSDITAAAAEAAVATLCDETSCPREIFDDANVILANGLLSSDHPDRSHQKEDLDVKEGPAQSETEEPVQDDIPVTLQLRAAIATAFGAAAARAKLLADQEDREIDHLVSTIIETQLKKLQCKIKVFDELEVIMEKDHAELEELKEHLIEERIDALQKAIDAGWKDRDSVRLPPGSVC